MSLMLEIFVSASAKKTIPSLHLSFKSIINWRPVKSTTIGFHLEPRVARPIGTTPRTTTATRAKYILGTTEEVPGLPSALVKVTTGRFLAKSRSTAFWPAGSWACPANSSYASSDSRNCNTHNTSVSRGQGRGGGEGRWGASVTGRSNSPRAAFLSARWTPSWRTTTGNTRARRGTRSGTALGPRPTSLGLHGNKYVRLALGSGRARDRTYPGTDGRRTRSTTTPRCTARSTPGRSWPSRQKSATVSVWMTPWVSLSSWSSASKSVGLGAREKRRWTGCWLPDDDLLSVPDTTCIRRLNGR